LTFIASNDGQNCSTARPKKSCDLVRVPSLSTVCSGVRTNTKKHHNTQDADTLTQTHIFSHTFFALLCTVRVSNPIEMRAGDSLPKKRARVPYTDQRGVGSTLTWLPRTSPRTVSTHVYSSLSISSPDETVSSPGDASVLSTLMTPFSTSIEYLFERKVGPRAAALRSNSRCM